MTGGLRQVYPYAQMDEWTNGRNWGNHSADAVPYCPNVMASLDARPAMEKGCVFTFPTKAEWVATLRHVKAIVETPGARLGYPSSSAPDGVQPAITIYSWNEYQEGGIVAPTEGEQYMKLEGIRAVFGRSGGEGPEIPAAAGAKRLKSDDSLRVTRLAAEPSASAAARPRSGATAVGVTKVSVMRQGDEAVGCTQEGCKYGEQSHAYSRRLARVVRCSALL